MGYDILILCDVAIGDKLSLGMYIDIYMYDVVHYWTAFEPHRGISYI